MVVHWCADGLTPEDRADYNRRIKVIHAKLPYFADQVEGTQYALDDVERSKGTTSEADFKEKLSDAKLANTESCTNYNSANRQLDIIDRDLENNTKTTVKNTAGIKRERDFYESDIEDSSSKR